MNESTVNTKVNDNLVDIARKFNRKIGYIHQEEAVSMLFDMKVTEEANMIAELVIEEIFSNKLIGYHRASEIATLIMIELGRRGVKNFTW